MRGALGGARRVSLWPLDFIMDSTRFLRHASVQENCKGLNEEVFFVLCSYALPNLNLPRLFSVTKSY